MIPMNSPNSKGERANSMVLRVNGRRVRHDLRRRGLHSDIRFAVTATLATVVIGGILLWLLWLVM